MPNEQEIDLVPQSNNTVARENGENNHLVADQKTSNTSLASTLLSVGGVINTEANIANSVIDLGENVVKNSTKFIANSINAVVDTGERIVERGVDIVQNAADVVTAPAKMVVNTVTGAIEEVNDVVTGIKTGIAVGKVMLDISNTIRENQKNKDDSYGPQNIKHLDTKELEPSDHFIINDPAMVRERNFADDYFATPEDHFTYDAHATEFGEESDHKENALYSDGTPKFSGSSTLVNPTGDLEKALIAEEGYDYWDTFRYNYEELQRRDKRYPSPLSPLRPFTSTDPVYAHKSIFSSYNRTLIPIADAEFRKGFKHIMISRPECYIMWNGKGLSQQAEYDIDFNSAYTRMPHICELLSPSYIAGGRLEGTTGSGVLCNWNFLLSNMISTFSGDYKTSISTKEGMTKSIEGHTVLPGGTLQSTQGGTISITFRETKRLEVYECLKLWMLYIHKIRKGIFAPSYNGYMYENSYLPATTVKADYPMYHPYDRALDYTCSIFENITNETMSQVLYWDKWYGCYPIEATLNGIDSSTNAITGPLTVTAVFRYQYKAPACRNINLIEFNYNAGLVDHIGHAKTIPDTEPNYLVTEEINGVHRYMGPTDLFTGTPYIVMGRGPQNLVTKGFDSNRVWVPYLRFAHCTDDDINGYMNISLTKAVKNEDFLVTSS
jgi:hypothetical protein